MTESMDSNSSQTKSILRKLRFLYYGYSEVIKDPHLPLLIYAWLLNEMEEDSLLKILENASEENVRLIDIDCKFVNIHDYQIPETTLEGIKLVRNLKLLELEPEVALSILDQEIARYINFYEEPRTPRWLCDFMVKLADINGNARVLNPYNNNGEILTAALRNNDKVHTCGFSKSIGSAIWSMIEHIILHRDCTDNIHVNAIESSYQPSPNPTHIISSPFFGKTQFNLYTPWLFYKTDRLEELYLQYALWIIKSGGRIVFLVPDGLLFGGGARVALREYLFNFTDLKAIIAIDKGNLTPYSGVKANILIIDVGSMKRSEHIFMSEIRPFKNKDVFNCEDISGVKEVLEEYKRWDIQHIIYSIKQSWLVQKQEVDIRNLTVNRYIPTKIAFNVEEKPPYDLKLLGDIAISIENGKKYKVSEMEKYAVLTSASIRRMKILSDQIIKSDFCQSSFPIHVQRDDVLINAIGSQIGESVLITEDNTELYVGNNVIRIKPNIKVVLPKYLEIALNSQYVKQQFQLRTGGTVIATISANRIRDILIPVPSISGQERIIEALNNAKKQLDSIYKQFKDVEKAYNDIIATLKL